MSGFFFRFQDSSNKGERMPTAFIDTSTWAGQGLCRTLPAQWWFAEDNRTPEGRADTQRAIRYCTLCPVKEECLNYALSMKEEHGIWGGMTPRERGMRRDRRTIRGPY